MRDSFIFYKSFYEALRELPPEDQARTYDAVMAYVFDGIEPELTGVCKAMFSLIKPQIDANIRRRENGEKGGRPKTETEPNCNQTETETKPKDNLTVTETKPNHNLTVTETEPNVNVNDNVNVNVNDKEKGKKESGFAASCREIVEMYNRICVSFPKITTLSDARKKAIAARLRVYSLEDFKRLFEQAEASAFLKGSNARNWSATFDWLIKDSNMAKVLDGNYNPREGPQRKETFMQGNISASDLELIEMLSTGGGS